MTQQMNGVDVSGQCRGWKLHWRDTQRNKWWVVRGCNAGCWDGGVFRGEVTQSGFSATVTHRAGSGSKGVGFDVVGFQAGTYDL